MPMLNVHHSDILSYNKRMNFDLIDAFLRTQCAERFSISTRRLKPTSFSIYYHLVTAPSKQTHDLIVRASLHPDPERTDGDVADDHCKELSWGLEAILSRPEVDTPIWRPSARFTIEWGEVTWPELGG